MECSDAKDWAYQTFGNAQLGDPRRTRRLVAIAAAVARRPAGKVTQSVAGVAAREGAFRFLESTKFKSHSLQTAAFDASSLLCAGGVTFISIDQTSLNFVDRQQAKGLGPVGLRNSSTYRGMQVMTALGMDERGVPVGVLEQETWLRPEDRTPHGKGDPRSAQERESWKWVTTLRGAEERLKEAAPGSRRWYVCDRGADFWGFLTAAVETKQLFTLRSSYERTIRRNGRNQSLWKTLKRQQVLGTIKVSVPGSAERAARVAKMEIQALTSEVRISRPPHGEQWEKLSCLRVIEKDTCPSSEAPIEWKLLSNHSAETFDECVEIVRSYRLRWRVEEFHKTWKSGACNVEATQLRTLEAIKRWATILATVAVRIERLKRLSRETPEVSALSELSRAEVDAAILISETSRHAKGDELTLQQAVRLIGIVGGHMGRKGDGPPGSITLRRGLELITPAALALASGETSG